MKATALLGGDALARSLAHSAPCSCALAGRSEELNAKEGGRKLYEEEMVTSSTYHFPEAGGGSFETNPRLVCPSKCVPTDRRREGGEEEGLEILKNERHSEMATLAYKCARAAERVKVEGGREKFASTQIDVGRGEGGNPSSLPWEAQTTQRQKAVLND